MVGGAGCPGAIVFIDDPAVAVADGATGIDGIARDCEAVFERAGGLSSLNTSSKISSSISSSPFAFLRRLGRGFLPLDFFDVVSGTCG